jgi:hypothetical protein
VTENRPTDPRLSHDSPHLSHGRPIRPFSQSSHTPVSFTSDQINHLRIQIHAFKLLPRDVPIQESIQSVVTNPHHATHAFKLLSLDVPIPEFIQVEPLRPPPPPPQRPALLSVNQIPTKRGRPST